ncbi:four helix bundle protein [Alkaliphilus peptidifermentans]|uniref:Four helix bundle protein n=1 Tax=Alkaliphilus peptidifermentans DSM 18978 TaxID=1120976 RepID=A0A1G5AIP1_9FIRM|nr:four helix bundle protein [Alkaliphilus peptidifermentans]SCX77742.1 four helix bundle protein [Alkaliphilus peptidifermentans DSM 18978]
MGDNILENKSYRFSLQIVKLSRYMKNSKKEYDISRQLLRSGTSVGANIVEAQDAESKKDFIHKLSISLKEANETRYWLRLIRDSHEVEKEIVEPLLEECNNLRYLLISIIKKTKENTTKSC